MKPEEDVPPLWKSINRTSSCCSPPCNSDVVRSIERVAVAVVPLVIRMIERVDDVPLVIRTWRTSSCCVPLLYPPVIWIDRLIHQTSCCIPLLYPVAVPLVIRMINWSNELLYYIQFNSHSIHIPSQLWSKVILIQYSIYMLYTISPFLSSQNRCMIDGRGLVCLFSFIYHWSNEKKRPNKKKRTERQKDSKENKTKQLSTPVGWEFLSINSK